MTLTPLKPNERLETPPEILQYGQTCEAERGDATHERHAESEPCFALAKKYIAIKPIAIAVTSWFELTD